MKDPLRPMPMTPAEVRDLVERACASTTQYRIDSGRQTIAKWDAYRAAQDAELDKVLS